MRNRLKILFWKIIYRGMIDPETEIRKCVYCGKIYLVDEDSIRYRLWNRFHEYYEIYFLCSTGKGSCYAKFIAECVEAPKESDEISIYVVS